MVSFCKQSHVLKASLLFLLNYLETGRRMTIFPPEQPGTGGCGFSIFPPELLGTGGIFAQRLAELPFVKHF